MVETERTPPTRVWRIRTVVVNWNSFQHTDRCLVALRATASEHCDMEVVVVDNGSADGSLERLRREHEGVTFIENGENLGFAEACNRGMRDRSALDGIALVNNDATVEPGWLDALTTALERDPRAGAAAALLILDPPFYRLDLRAESLLELTRASVDSARVTDRVLSDGAVAVGDPEWPLDTRLTFEGECTFWVPAPADATSIELTFASVGSPSASSRLLHVAERDGPVRDGGIEVVDSGHEVIVRVEPTPERTQLINGLGTARTVTGEAFDIGFGLPVDQLDGLGPTPVDGFCGGGVLLRCQALDEVGLFDPRFFAYYEDTDLSWRMARAGWRVATVPEARILHLFGGAGGARAPWFFHLNYRNWMLTTLRNGNRTHIRLALAQLRQWLRPAFRANVVGRLRRGQRPSMRLIRAWSRVLVDVALEAPRIILARLPNVGPGRPGERRAGSVSSLLQPVPSKPLRD